MSLVPDFLQMNRKEKARFSGINHVPFCRTISVRFSTIDLETVPLTHICTKGSLSSGSVKLFRTVPFAPSSSMYMNSSNENYGDNVRCRISRKIPFKIAIEQGKGDVGSKAFYFSEAPVSSETAKQLTKETLPNCFRTNVPFFNAMRFMCFMHFKRRLEKRASMILIWLANGTD